MNSFWRHDRAVGVRRCGGSNGHPGGRRGTTRYTHGAGDQHRHPLAAIHRAHVSPHQSPLLLAGLLPRCPRGIQSHAILLDT